MNIKEYCFAKNHACHISSKSPDYTQGKGVAKVFNEIFARHILLIFNS